MENKTPPNAEPKPHPLASDPRVLRSLRVFGPRRLPQYLKHLDRLQNGKPWFVFVGSKGARFFTHFIKLDKPVKNPRSITGSQKYIANAENDGVIF